LLPNLSLLLADLGLLLANHVVKRRLGRAQIVKRELRIRGLGGDGAKFADLLFKCSLLARVCVVLCFKLLETNKVLFLEILPASFLARQLPGGGGHVRVKLFESTAHSVARILCILELSLESCDGVLKLFAVTLAVFKRSLALLFKLENSASQCCLLALSVPTLVLEALLKFRKVVLQLTLGEFSSFTLALEAEFKLSNSNFNSAFSRLPASCSN